MDGEEQLLSSMGSVNDMGSTNICYISALLGVASCDRLLLFESRRDIMRLWSQCKEGQNPKADATIDPTAPSRCQVNAADPDTTCPVSEETPVLPLDDPPPPTTPDMGAASKSKAAPEAPSSVAFEDGSQKAPSESLRQEEAAKILR